MRQQLSKKEQSRFFESRVMSVPQATQGDRLSVIGWLEDEQGQVLMASQTLCLP